MKPFLKFFALTVGVQIVAVLALGLLATILPAMNSLLVVGFYFYTPTILLVWTIGGFKGEGALVWPLVLGIPLGIFLYSFIFARVWVDQEGKRRILDVSLR